MVRDRVVGQLLVWLWVVGMPVFASAADLALTVSVPHPGAESGVAVNRLRLGMLASATDAFDPAIDLEAFPASALTAAILHLDYAPAQGTLWWDIRSATFPQAWQVEVNSDQASALVTLSWTPPAAETGCAQSRWTLRDIQTGQTIDLTSASANYTYTNAVGVTRRFEVAALQVLSAAPLAPTNLWSPRQGRSSVYLAWSGAGEPEIRYHVYRATNQGVVRLTSVPIANSTYLDTGADLGSAVSYRVTAVTESGCESAPSAALDLAPRR